MTKRSLSWVMMACLLAACGETRIPDDGEGGSGGKSGSSDSGTDGGTGDASDAADGASVDCDMVREKLGTLLERARVCDPAINMVQCDVVVQGLCCPQVVVKAEAQKTYAYLAAVEDAKAVGCDDICAVVDCAQPAGGFCQPDQTGAGACEEIY